MTKGLWAGPAATIYNRSIIPQILILSEHLLPVTRWNGKKKLCFCQKGGSTRVHLPPETLLKYLLLPSGTTPSTENKAASGLSLTL